MIVHTPSLPKNMNYAIENSGYTRRWLYEVHETLLLQDWWTTQWVPNVAKSFTVEDLVLLKEDAEAIAGEIQAEVVRRGDGEEGRRAVRAVYGSVMDSGDSYTVTPHSKGHSLANEVEIPKDAVERVEQGSVFTFELNEGVNAGNRLCSSRAKTRRRSRARPSTPTTFTSPGRSTTTRWSTATRSGSCSRSSRRARSSTRIDGALSSPRSRTRSR